MGQTLVLVGRSYTRTQPLILSPDHLYHTLARLSKGLIKKGLRPKEF